jgi:hypothetical protein
VRAANSAGCDYASFRSEAYQNVSFESSFSNDDRFSRQQISRLEGEVDWRGGSGAAEWKRAGEPSILLFADAKIVSVKSKLAGLDSAFVVAVWDHEQWHVVITRAP